jgi:hypothetical protein
MRRASIALMVVSAFLVASCWPVWYDDGYSGYDDDWCECWSYSETTCYGSDTLGVCEDGCDFYYYDCDTICRDAGFATSEGCDWDYDTYQDVCWCSNDDDPPPVTCDCTYGQTECWGSDFVMTCDDGCNWSTWDCADLCAESGWTGPSECGYDTALGEYSCTCYEDTPSCDCEYGQMECWDDWSIASCDDGCWWSVYDCDELCADSGWDYSTGCGYDYSTSEDACFCETL